MKKLLSILLCIVMIFCSASVAAFAAEDGIKVIVANDLHLSLRAYSPYTGNTAADSWAHVPSSGQLILESNAIITAFLENAAKSDADFVLLPGDLVDSGLEEEHVLMAAKLREFENATGKQVYVVPGNHDVFKSSKAVFEELYADFGYNQAIVNDDASGSYIADLDDNYRILAIDTTIPGDGTADLGAEKLEWVKTQLENAKAEGKHVIAMMHHNLLEHYIFGSSIHAGAIVKDEAFKDVLADNGVKYIFTGHTHDHDMASYTSAAGNTIYDVVTNSINGYPCQYREVSFAKEAKFETKKIESIDLSLLPAGLSAEAMALAEENFTQYTKTVMWTGMRKTFTGYINAAALIKLMKLDAEANPDMYRIITSLGDKLEEIASMPFYAEDANGNSMQKIAASYGKTLPASSYKDLIDLGITLYQAHCVGDEYYPANSTEVQLLMAAVETVLCYCLQDLSAEDYTTVLKFAFTLTGTAAPDSILNFAGGAVDRVQGIELVVSLVLRPMVVQFTTDTAPADGNVTLEGYEKLTDLEIFMRELKAFFAKIAEFFKKIFSFMG